MNEMRTGGMRRAVLRTSRLVWSFILAACVLAAALGHSMYAAVLGAHSWSDELRESGMPAAAASYARAYIWELAELDRLDELGRWGYPLERRLEQVLAGYLSDRWVEGQLDRLQAGLWDVLEGKRATLPPLDVSELKDKLTSEVTRVIPYSVLRRLGWELAVPERIDTMEMLKLERAELAEWRAAYLRAGQSVRWLIALGVVWLGMGLALSERPHAALGWMGGSLLAAAVLLLVLQAGVERGSADLARQLLADAMHGQQPAPEARAVYSSAVHIVETWLRETGRLAAGWAWATAAAGGLALLSGWLCRRMHGKATHSAAAGMRLPRGVRLAVLASGLIFAGVALAVIL